MASLQNFKRRIKSIDSAGNVARAMELVSSVKLKKLKRKYDDSISYLDSLEDTIGEILYLKKENIKFNDEGEVVNVVITSNLGLCGAYNEEILKLVSKENKQDGYIVFGEKGRKYLKSNGYQIILSYKEYGEFNDSKVQDEFSNHIIKLVKDKKIKELNVIYTKYINNLNSKVIKETLYPFVAKVKESKTKYLIEPDSEEMLQEVISLYVKTKVTSVLLNATLSENASRNNAMKKAKDNADDLKKELILYYNKLRQQEITNELSDIVNGI